ncbi:MAG: dicarboxylate/amino acid:cation symporter, partial [Fidelibacterota bacterium]
GKTGLGLIADLAKYMSTVLIGLFIHGFITLPLLLKIIGRESPLKFARHMSSALATAFSTSSSSATLPITMEAIEVNAGVSKKISSFVLPLGATVNMDGTALYESVAAMFIAQAYGIDLGLGQQILIFITATLAAIGAAGIPSAGLITMIIVLKQVNLPLEGIGIITAVDRILDMCRTTVNVWGDSVGARVIAQTENEVERNAHRKDSL